MLAGPGQVLYWASCGVAARVFLGMAVWVIMAGADKLWIGNRSQTTTRAHVGFRRGTEVDLLAFVLMAVMTVRLA